MPRKKLTLADFEVAKEWHPTRNGNLTPDQVAPKSAKKRWWQCPKCGFPYEARVYSRTNGSGCPVCARKVATAKYNYAAWYPEVAKYWHPTKNDFRLEDVTPGSGRKGWWLCEEGHEVEAYLYNRRYHGCSACKGLVATPENNLAVKYPNVATEWHPSENGSLTPYDVAPFSNKKVTWLCKRGHKWKAAVANRTNLGTGCPKCRSRTSKQEIRIFCELQTIFGAAEWMARKARTQCDVYVPELNAAIEYDGFYYHADREDHDREKNKRLETGGIMPFRIREAGLVRLSDRDVLLAPEASGLSMIKSLLNVLLENAEVSEGHRLKIREYLDRQDFANEDGFRKTISHLPGPPPEDSLARIHPRVAKEWDYETNSPLTPTMFHPTSHEIVSWKCKKGHRWKASIANRTQGRGCPMCGRKKPSPENNLAKAFPHLVNEWHPTRNRDRRGAILKPEDVLPFSNKKRWWKCQKRGHEWEATVANRANGNGCPYCSNRLVCADNNLAVMRPDLAEEYHPDLNDEPPTEVLPRSAKKRWWKCKKCGHVWQASPHNRGGGRGCPECYKRHRKRGSVS